MSDPWRSWDERVRRTGRPDRVARECTDEELVAFVRARSQEEREQDRRIVADELERRLLRAQRPWVDGTRATTLPSDGPRRGAHDRS